MPATHMEIIFAGGNDIASTPPTKEQAWGFIQAIKRDAESKGMVVAIADKVVAEFGPSVATQAKEGK